jgi:hypothetical protein
MKKVLPSSRRNPRHLARVGPLRYQSNTIVLFRE